MSNIKGRRVYVGYIDNHGMPEDETMTFDELVALARPMLAKLGHRSVEWALGPEPHKDFHVHGTCKHCGCLLKLQRSMFVIQMGRKKVPSHRWELISGTYVAAYYNAETKEMTESMMFDRCICERLAALL